MNREIKRLFYGGFGCVKATLKSLRVNVNKVRRSRVLATTLLLGFLISFVPAVYFGIPQQRAGAAGSVAFGGSTTGTNDQGNSVTINKSSVTVSGDLLVAIIMVQGQNPTITFSTGAGTWTNITTITNGTTSTTMLAYRRIAGASEPASYTFSSSGGNTRWAGAISVYKGADGTTPIEAQSSTNTNVTTDTNPITLNSVTSTSANARIVTVYGVEHDTTQTFTAPTGTKERFDVGSARVGVGNADVSMSSADIAQHAAGASGSKDATVTAMDNSFGFQYAIKPDGVIRMLLFWDGGAAPTGWSIIDDFDGMYPRGEVASNFGVTGGGLTHTPTTSSVGQNYVNGGNSNNLSSGTNGSFWSSQGHNHGATVTVGSASNEPANTTLKLIRYDAGVPNTIPANAIALFDGDPGIPASGWTDLSQTGTDAFYQRMIKVSSTAGTATGSDTHTHGLTWSSLAATTAQTEGANPFFANGTTATIGHTHTAPAGTTTASITTIPDYIVPQLAKAGADTATISVGITAMFDGDPGGGWVIRSQSSGTSLETPFYQRFLRPGPTYSSVASCTTQGCNTHSHSASTSGNSGTNVGAGTNNNNLNLSIPPAISGNGHAHTLTANFNANTDNTPPYFDVVIAEKVNFIMQAFYWYNDNDSVDLSTPATLPWGNPNIAVNTGIVALPLVPSDPPDLTRELRLRIQILINGNNLVANVVRYKLQYNASLSTSCTTSTGTWTDVAESSNTTAEWRFATSTPAGETSLTQSVFSPASTVLGRYVKSNSGTNNNPAATVGDTLEYDFHIQHNAAAGGTRYSFRIIESTGTLLSQYDACPSLITYPRTENQMRHGNFFLGGVPDTSTTGSQEQGFSWNE
jgi:hypothetical protein